jgi:site-specific recombinase XerD
MAQTKNFIARSYSVKGHTYWRVKTGRTATGNASYEAFGTDMEAAEAYAKKLNDRAKAKRMGELDAITKEEANDLRWSIQKLALYGATVKEATEWYVKTKFPEQGNKTAVEAGEIYLKFRAGEVKENTLESYETKIERFSNYFGEKLINEISTADCEKYFNEVGKAWGPNTENPEKNMIRFYFRWLQKQGYLHREGYTAMDKIKIPQKKYETPKLATPMEANNLLLWFVGDANKRDSKNGKEIAENIRGCIVHLVLILFCGIRREEAVKITWAQIDFKGEFLKVLQEGSKKKQRRVNKAEPNVWNWLRYLKKKGANLNGYEKVKGKTSDPLRRLTYRTRKYRDHLHENRKQIPEIVATLEYEDGYGKKDIKAKNQNIMRHSFISYHMKLYNNAGKTAAIAGNSERQVESTYLEMVDDQRDAKLWFSINPPEIIDKSEIIEDQMTVDEAFEKFLKIKFMAANTSLDPEIAEVHDELVAELNAWEYEVNPDTGDLNLHDLAKKKEWWDDPKVQWVNGAPMIKEIKL